MKHPPTAVLFLLSCVVSMSPWSRFTTVTASWVGQPESSYASRMALFEHVLHNDAEWSPVLKQKVKLSSLTLPNYRRTEFNGEVLDHIELVGKHDDQNPTAMKVLQTLMDKTPWSGTNVNYTAYVLSTAVMCFTYTNVSFLLSLVIDRIGMLARKMRKPDTNTDDKVDEKIQDMVDDVQEDVRTTFEVLVDKVAAVDGELVFFTTGLHGLDAADKTKDDFVIFEIFGMMKKEVDMRLERHCYRTPLNDVYHYLSKNEALNDSPTPPDELTPDEDTLTRELDEFNKVVDSIIDVYDGLNVKTLPMETWIIILDYRLPISMDIKFYIDGSIKDTTGETPKKEMSEQLRESKNLKEQQYKIRRRRRKRTRRIE